MDEDVKQQIIRWIDKEIDDLVYELKCLDRQYIKCQKRLRELRRSRKEIAKGIEGKQ